MSSPSRLQAALPAIVTFVFGLTFGLVAGRILWGSQPGAAQGGGMPARMGEAGGAMEAPPEDMGSGVPDEAQLRQLLAQHEKLLETSPDDIGLVRTLGNYQSLLGDNDKALELYARAKALATKAGDQAAVLEIYVDEGISMVEKGDVVAGLAHLEECSKLDPSDVRSRLTRVAVYLQRVLPQPPPGLDRKQAIAAAEVILDEVKVLDPDNEYAAQFRAMIESVRSSMGRPRTDGAPAAPGAEAPAAASAPSP